MIYNKIILINIYIYNNIFKFIKILIIFCFFLWGLGIGDWGLGIGDWAQSPITNPQCTIPNPHYMKLIHNTKFI